MLHRMLRNIAWKLKIFNENLLSEKQLSDFASVGSGVLLNQPAKLLNPQRMVLKDNVKIFPNSRIFAITDYEGISMDPELVIGENTYIGSNSHITITNRIEIGKDVLIANGSYISDNLHEYKDITMPIMKQPLAVLGKITIGDGSWVGEHVCIFGDIEIGKHCVVGSNAVLTRSMPDYSVAVGIPAKIIKRYNQEGLSLFVVGSST